ncbi:MAG: hypothetical protein ACJAZ3_000289 [Sphingobacteriales bacterium]|jgi:hypothetical protein
MKRTLLIPILLILTNHIFAQSVDPIPYQIANGKLEILTFSDSYPSYFKGWRAERFFSDESPDGPTEDQAITVMLPSAVESAAGYINSRGDDGITIRHYCPTATQGTETVERESALGVGIALNTIGAKQIQISWKAATAVLNGQTETRLQLQYRIGNSAEDSAWNNVAGHQYLAKTGVDGNTYTDFGPFEFPVKLEEQPVVQLRWICYTVAGVFCNTDAITLDEIIVESLDATPQAPTAAFSVDKSNPKTEEPITFSSESIGNPTEYLWDFGDGETSTVKNPIKVYNIGGTFTVTFTVTNEVGKDTLTKIDFIMVEGDGPGTSVEDVKAEKFKMFPNPSSSLISFEFENFGQNTIVISNLLGEVAKELITRDQMVTMSVNDLPKGLYLVKVSGNTKTLVVN